MSKNSVRKARRGRPTLKELLLSPDPKFNLDLPPRRSLAEESLQFAGRMPEWPVQEAKARFSEFLEASETRGPQLVTKRGEEKAVLIPIRLWRRLTEPPKRNAIEVLLAPEARIDDLPVPDRKMYRGRKIPRF